MLLAQAGVEDVGAGMSVCWFDYDNDGAEDLYVANMWTAAGKRISTQEIFQKDAPEAVRALYRKHAMGNSLFRNQRRWRLSGPSALRWSRNGPLVVVKRCLGLRSRRFSRSLHRERHGLRPDRAKI